MNVVLASLYFMTSSFACVCYCLAENVPGSIASSGIMISATIIWVHALNKKC
jgi:hypothetical protein